MKRNVRMSRAGKFFLPAAAFGLLALQSCGGGGQKNETAEGAPKDVIKKEYLDTTVKPGADFYQYANGGWLKKNPIPETESSWGSFNELRNANMATLKKVLEDAAKNKDAAAGTNEQKLRDFYVTAMDSQNVEKLGISPLQGELKRIADVKDIKGLTDLIAHQHLTGTGSVFGFYVDQDAKQSTVYAAYAVQGGLGLPDRDYYFNQDERSKKIRADYLAHIARTLELSGEKADDAKKHAETIMGLETALAQNSMTRLQMRDPYAVYNKKTLAEAAALSPSLDWNQYLKDIGIPPVQYLIVSQPEFFKSLSQMLRSEPIESWKTYMKFHTISGWSPYLSSNFVNENFSFYGTTLSGAKKLEPRWKRTLKTIDNGMGEILGQEYVKVAFKPEAKAKMVEMVNNLKAALKDRINGLEWMSPATKEQAQKKLSAIVVKIGYPDKWRDYSTLDIKAGDLVGNVMRANEFEFKRNLAKIGKPIDRTEWGMTPPTVNAYYNPAMNEIVFPAGILQPPFFNPNGDDAMNYGSIGAVIGHELTHGFDDEGRKFDAEGNLKEWWTKEDAAKFEERAAVVVKQFNAYNPLDTLHINGQLTLGENIADLGGLKIAYHAFQKSLQGKPEPPVIDGFTADQRFFLAWAQGWRINYRPEALSRQILTNPHSPGKYRVLGPLSNLEEFHKAFGLKEGDPMVRPANERARIW